MNKDDGNAVIPTISGVSDRCKIIKLMLKFTSIALSTAKTIAIMSHRSQGGQDLDRNGILVKTYTFVKRYIVTVTIKSTTKSFLSR